MPSRAGPWVQASCTSGNFGPGFDVFSLSVGRGGDRARVVEASEDAVAMTGPFAGGLPDAWDANCASAAVAHLRDALKMDAHLRVEVEKHVPPGSGLGSSASSSAAGALAFYHAFKAEHDLTPRMLLDAAAAGERAGAGAAHRDDVSAALFGGLALVPPVGMPRRLEPPRGMRLAYAVPDVKLETKRMRAVLPDAVPRADLVFNLHQVAAMVDAVHRGDVAAMGAALADRVSARYRGPLVPGFESARAAALDAGALGFALSGSGPAFFALTDSDAAARDALAAMKGVLSTESVPVVLAFTAGACYRTVDDVAVDVH